MDIQKIDEALRKATGYDFIQAEKTARALGDTTPSIIFSTTFQTVFLANLMKLAIDDIQELPIKQFTLAIGKVNSFLFSQEQEAPEK